MLEIKLGVNLEVKLGVGSKTGSKNLVLAFLKCTEGTISVKFVVLHTVYVNSGGFYFIQPELFKTTLHIL